MIVCELAPPWVTPDPAHPAYSFGEIDVYAWAPHLGPARQHRLSIRKNLQRGTWEVVRRMHKPPCRERVAFQGSLLEALRFASFERRRYWGDVLPTGCPCAEGPCDHATHRSRECPRGS